MKSPATTNPAQLSNKELIETLRRSRLFRQYERVFYKATGLPLVLRTKEYWGLAHHGKKHENAFCALLAQRPGSLSVCLQAHDQMIRRTGTSPHTVTCPFGLTETAVPLKLGDEVIGYLRVGQVLRRTPNRAEAAKVKQTLADCGVEFTDDVRAAWEQTRLVQADKYSATIRLLTFFADQLSALSNQLLTERRNAEPLLVARARRYIEQRKAEEISLADVATAAGARMFHFCKVFHRATGLTFTDYVARVRAEDARALLANPNQRVSEIAYQVGFQSLTQFNRTFKRVFGQTPTAFRSR